MEDASLPILTLSSSLASLEAMWAWISSPGASLDPHDCEDAGGVVFPCIVVVPEQGSPVGRLHPRQWQPDFGDSFFHLEKGDQLPRPVDVKFQSSFENTNIWYLPEVVCLLDGADGTIKEIWTLARES
ncbi:hypothetical protein ACQJBY_048243 [Aegilops geniculata]